MSCDSQFDCPMRHVCMFHNRRVCARWVNRREGFCLDVCPGGLYCFHWLLENDVLILRKCKISIDRF